MAALSVQSVAISGLTVSYVTPAGGGDTFTNVPANKVFLIVTNGSGSSINVTITAVNTTIPTISGGNLTLSDRVVAVGAGATKLIGAFPDGFNSSTGTVTVTCSATSSVTIAAIQVP